MEILNDTQMQEVAEESIRLMGDIGQALATVLKMRGEDKRAEMAAYLEGREDFQFFLQQVMERRVDALRVTGDADAAFDIDGDLSDVERAQEMMKILVGMSQKSGVSNRDILSAVKTFTDLIPKLERMKEDNSDDLPDAFMAFLAEERGIRENAPPVVCPHCCGVCPPVV